MIDLGTKEKAARAYNNPDPQVSGARRVLFDRGHDQSAGCDPQTRLLERRQMLVSLH